MDDEAVAQERKRLTRQARLKAKRLSMMQELDALFVEFDQDGNGQIDRSQNCLLLVSQLPCVRIDD
jgi:hypothetical protein